MPNPYQLTIVIEDITGKSIGGLTTSPEDPGVCVRWLKMRCPGSAADIPADHYRVVLIPYPGSAIY